MGYILRMDSNQFTRKNPDGSTMAQADVCTDADFIIGKISKPDAPLLSDAQLIVSRQETNHLALVDENAEPFTPIQDQRIERFLMRIVEGGITKTDHMYSIYKKAEFPLTGIDLQDKGTMRILLSKKRVKDRWNYLKESEWDIRKPTKLSLQIEYERIIDDPEVKPSDKLKALDGLTKLLGLADANELANNSTTVIFNSIDKPRITAKNKHTIDITAADTDAKE